MLQMPQQIPILPRPIHPVRLPLRNLTRRIQSRVVLDDGSVDVRAGEGILDMLHTVTKPLHRIPYIGKRVKFSTMGPRKELPKRFTDFLNKEGSEPLVSLEIARKPIERPVEKALNVLSFGGFDAAKKKLGYDNVYHNFMIGKTASGKQYVFHKNHVIESRPATAADLKTERYDIPLPTDKTTTIKDLVDTAINSDSGKPATEASRRRFVQYDPSTANCQVFTSDVVFDNGLMPSDPKALNLLEPQDAPKLMDSLGPLKPIGKFVTDTAAVLDRARYGDGIVAESNKLSLPDTKMSYSVVSLHLTQAQAHRLLSGDAVRLSLSALKSEGTVPVLLTKRQMNKMAKSASKGVGCQLQLSEAQLKAMHQSKMGEGIIGDVFKKVGQTAFNGVKYVATSKPARFLASHALKTVGPKLIDGAIGATTGIVQGLAPDVARDLISAGADLGKRLSKDQLERFVSEIRNGSGLYPPGAGPVR